MKPVIVVIGCVVRNNKLLLIQRENKGTFPNAWCIPGGKLEPGEHVAAAAVREIKEETGLETTFEEELGVISELLHGNGEKHYVVHLCRLSCESDHVQDMGEGQPQWFTFEQIEELENIIPTVRRIVHNVIRNRTKHYWESEMEFQEGKYVCTKFS